MAPSTSSVAGFGCCDESVWECAKCLGLATKQSINHAGLTAVVVVVKNTMKQGNRVAVAIGSSYVENGLQGEAMVWTKSWVTCKGPVSFVVCGSRFWIF